MSRTDKDRPWDVQCHDETLAIYIDHDHRLGACVIDGITWRVFQNHYRTCKKSLRGVLYCTRKNPIISGSYFPKQLCWYTKWDGTRIGCVGHRMVDYDRDIPCACDDFPPRSTCEYRIGGGDRLRVYPSIAPKWYTDHRWNNPERVRERDQLNSARHLYNTDPEFIDDFDFPNPQHRHGATWDWA